MSPLRITGLVKFAERVRRELSSPLSPSRREQLREQLADVRRQVEGILAQHGAGIEALPIPSRRAYEFLVHLDLESETPCVEAAADQPAQAKEGNIRLAGLKSFWEGLLRRLTRPATPSEYERLYESIRSTSEKIEGQLDHDGIEASRLTAQSRVIRGWLAYFSQRPSFDAYVAALGRARPALDDALQRSGRFHPPAMIEFRPTTGLFQARGYPDGTQIILPTPMISFSAEIFTQLARAVMLGDNRQPILEATTGDEYQDIQAELDALCGVEERPAGVHHDLAASFGRVNQEYFGGGLSRPRLTWSRAFGGRKFGHYDPIHDTVMISGILDRATAPDYVIDFVVYHELLHKKLGIDWSNGWAATHTAEFRERERQFARYADADALLKQLAAGSLR